MFSFLLFLLLQAGFASANTEKIIFLGPSSLQVPLEHPTLENLQLDVLSPHHWSLRTYIQAEFPTNSSKYGQSSWYLLDRLQEGQRYEVRICWAATQPTSFHLYTYDIPTAFETPELMTSLADYSEARQKLDLGDIEHQKPSHSKYQKLKRAHDDRSSTLFLQVFAAADYYTDNKILMEYVPLVHVDLILDPYFFNVLPRSLVPTVAYIILLAVGSWYIAKYINLWVQNLAKHVEQPEKKKS